MPTNATEELRAYEAYVAEMAAKADGRVIKNSSLDHAEIIIAQIFKSSNQTVDILTGKLDECVYGSPRVLSAAAQFMSHEGATLRILSEAKLSDDHRLLSLARERAPDRVFVRQLPATVAPPSHFAIGDKMHLRLEGDKNTCKADAMFGETTHSERLSRAYDLVFKHVQ